MDRHTMPSAANSQNSMRQPANSKMAPPNCGARMGPKPVMSPRRESARAVWATSNRSRMTARGITLALPTPSACTTRQTVKEATPALMAQPRDPITDRASPQRSGGRRPRWSAREPNRSWLKARPAKKDGRVSSTAPAVVFRSWAIAGRAGRYMSREKGVRMEMAPSRISSFDSPRRF